MTPHKYDHGPSHLNANRNKELETQKYNKTPQRYTQGPSH